MNASIAKAHINIDCIDRLRRRVIVLQQCAGKKMRITLNVYMDSRRRNASYKSRLRRSGGRPMVKPSTSHNLRISLHHTFSVMNFLPSFGCWTMIRLSSHRSLCCLSMLPFLREYRHKKFLQ